MCIKVQSSRLANSCLTPVYQGKSSTVLMPTKRLKHNAKRYKLACYKKNKLAFLDHSTLHLYK